MASEYRPQANGLTEQSNSSIKNYLRKYLNSKGSKQPDWILVTSRKRKKMSLMRLKALMTRRMMLIMRKMKEQRMAKKEEWRDTMHLII